MSIGTMTQITWNAQGQRMVDGQLAPEEIPVARDLAIPKLLRRLIERFSKSPQRMAGAMIAAVETLSDTVTWQTAYIEQLEQRIETAGLAPWLPACFNCQSGNVEREQREGQRRMTCRDCGYQWRLGVKDI